MEKCLSMLLCAVVLALASFAHANKIVTINGAIAIRKEPSIFSDTSWKTRTGDKLEILDEQKKWVKVKRKDGKIGWIYASLIRSEKNIPSKKYNTYSNQGANISYSSNSTPNCKSLIDDIDYLNTLYNMVTSPDYIVTKESCSSIVSKLDERFGYEWGQLRGVTPFYSVGEPKIMTQARAFGVTCTSIVQDFACTPPAELTREFGASIISDYRRDYKYIIQRLRSECRKIYDAQYEQQTKINGYAKFGITAEAFHDRWNANARNLGFEQLVVGQISIEKGSVNDVFQWTFNTNLIVIGSVNKSGTIREVSIMSKPESKTDFSMSLNAWRLLVGTIDPQLNKDDQIDNILKELDLFEKLPKGDKEIIRNNIKYQAMRVLSTLVLIVGPAI